MSKDSESISKFYQDFSKDLRWTSRSYAVELAGFVKILYLITGIFIIVTVYLIYQLLSTRPRHRLKKTKPSRKSIVLLSSPIFLDGHQQVMSFMVVLIEACNYRVHPYVKVISQFADNFFLPESGISK